MTSNDRGSKGDFESPGRKNAKIYTVDGENPAPVDR